MKAYQKSLKLAAIARQRLQSKPLRYLVVGLLLFGLWLLASYLMYHRFPNNLLSPNFYSEDGKVFAKNIIDNGFWQAIGTSFNGYYVWGIYLLEQAGIVVNKLLFGGAFTELPRSLALVSYGFLGLCASLPILLLRKYLAWPALVIMTLLILYVPLRGWDYSIIGTIGNLKFVFIYVAFVLLVYRHYLPAESRKFYIVDAAILICAYTNVTVYLLLPFALLRYLPSLGGKGLAAKIWKLVRSDHSLQSLLVLGVLLLPQLYFVQRDGVPPLPGYLDTPYELDDTVEIFGVRSYLYELVYPFYKQLSDVGAVMLLLVAGASTRWANKRYRPILVFGWAAIFLGTFLFVIKRTGVSSLFNGYSDAGPDQFFFAQNMIASVLVGIVSAGLLAKIHDKRARWAAYGLLSIGFIVYAAPLAGSYGKNNFMADSVGPIYATAKQACLDSRNRQPVDIAVYPSQGQIFEDVHYDIACTTKTLSYQPPSVSLGLSPYNNSYVAALGTTNTVNQTFKSPRDNLDGLNIYFSTFMQKVTTPYQLLLMSEDCRTTIASAKLDISDIADNSHHLVTFKPQPDSANKTYCFSVRSTQKDNSSPLAIQLSQPDAYTDGEAIINQKFSNQDVVFGLHYKTN